MLTIVTGNKSKFESAMKRLEPFGIEVEQQVLEILEPQSEDIRFVAEYKVNQAFEKLKKPVLISDTGWSIHSVKGFPGPLMHYIIDWFEPQDYLNLMKDKNDRTIIMVNFAAYRDENGLQIFESKRVGKILFEAKGTGNSLDQVITFRTDNKTVAECKTASEPLFDHDVADSIWSQFGEWYAKNIK